MRRRFLLFIPALLLLFSIVVSNVAPVFADPTTSTDSSTPSVSADDIQNATLQWLNMGTIGATVGSNFFIFKVKGDDVLTYTNIQKPYTYNIQGYDCTGKITVYISGNGDHVPATGKLDMDYKDSSSAGNTGCQNVGKSGQSITKDIANPENFDVVFIESAGGNTISRFDGSSDWSFTQSPQYDNLYTRDSENNKACQDIIETSGSTFKLYELTKASGNGNAPAEIHAAGCDVVTQGGSSSHLVSGKEYKLGLTTTDSTTDNSGNAATNVTGDNNTDNTGIKCGGTLSITWLLCPITKGMAEMVGGLDGFINSLLNIDPTPIFGNNATGNAYHTAWSVVSRVALALIVIAGLVMILSQALGLEIVDAYTIRKVLPRLFIATIGVTLSWQLLAFAVNLSNDLGMSVRGIIYAPFKDLPASITPGNSGAALAVIGLVAAAFIYQLAILTFVGTAALAIMIAVIVLVIREILVVGLLILAPLAIACYVLPNTQNIYKIWWDWFSKALLMYPIIMAFLAVGRVFATVASVGDPNPLQRLIAFVAYFAPYFLIPLTFRFAGGAIRSVGGFVNDRNKGAFDRLRKIRQGSAEKHMGHYKERVGTRALQQRYGAYHSLNAAASNTNNNWGKRKLAAFGARRVGGHNIEERISHHNAENAKRLSDQTMNGPDNLVRAYTVNKDMADQMRNSGVTGWEQYSRINDKGQLEYQTLGGAWVSSADVDLANRAWGKNNHGAFQAALTYEMGKALTQENQDHLINSYGMSAKRFGMDAHEAGEVWIGSAFAKQNENRQWKHYRWENDSMRAGGMRAEMKGLNLMREIDEKQGNFQMLQQNADTWTTMGQEVVNARQVKNSLSGRTDLTDPQRTQLKEADETLQRAARIAYATKSAGFSDSGMGLDSEGNPAQVRTPVGGGRAAGAGAPGRVQEEVNKFLLINEQYGDTYAAPGPSSVSGLPDPNNTLQNRSNHGRNN